jgi:pimeloyl-ACP methyl ester carboxylesterase
LSCVTIHVSHARGETLSHTSHYLRDNPDNSTVIVFVHGLFGDSVSTWTNGNGAYWPELMKNDPDFNKANIYMINYSSSVIAKAYSINELAECMRRDLLSDKVLNHTKLIFLVYSMGGLVTREFLLKYQEYTDKISFLYFFATPTSGSSIARVMKYLSPNPQYAGMVPLKYDDSLAAIQRNWKASEQMRRIKSYSSLTLAVEVGKIFYVTHCKYWVRSLKIQKA